MPGFHNLLVEIRLQVYSELLTQSETIVVPWCPGDWLTTANVSIYPEILRVNKMIHSEASRILYSENRFKCPGFRFAAWDDNIAKFLRGIGSDQAKSIHHVSITFPRFDYEMDEFDYTSSIITGVCRDDWLDLFRMHYTFAGITTLEVYSHGLPRRTDTRFYNPLLPVEAVSFLKKIFDQVPSLRKITIKIGLCVMDSSNDLMRSRDLIKRMRENGWVVKVKVPNATELTPPSAREFGYVSIERENEEMYTIYDWYQKYVDDESEYCRRFFLKFSLWSFSDPYYHHTRSSMPYLDIFVPSWLPLVYHPPLS